ncbi:MAG: hypothetical protein WDA74_06885 [Spirochaetota bacterium]
MGSEIPQGSEDNILILKGRFKSVSMNLYGLFLIIFNNTKQFDTYHIIVSSYSDMYEYEPHISWEKYEEYIVDKKWKGSFNNSMTLSLMEGLNNLTQDSNARQLLFDHTYNYNYDQIDVILYDVINRIIHDKNLIMETIIQEVSSNDFRKVKEDRSKPQEADEEKQIETGKQHIILKVKPIVAPVKGKPIYELKIGDRIMVRIVPSTTKENYYIDLYNLKEEKGIRPIPASVVDIKSTAGKNNPIEILVEIIPGVYGQFIEDEKQVKLRVFDPATDFLLTGGNQKNINSQSSIDEKTSSSEKSTFVMTMLFLIILALFFFLAYISL